MGVVVVFYWPDEKCVSRANRLSEAGLCVVVDNTEQLLDPTSIGLGERIIYIPNGANLGIAAAINQGVDRLIRAGCSSALIFDQDSEPTVELLEALPRLLVDATSDGQRVALIGSAYEDTRLGGVASFVRFGYFKLKRIPPEGSELIDVDFLI